MDNANMASLFQKFEEAKMFISDIECWSARAIMLLFDYSSWQNFSKVIERAKTSARNAGIFEAEHFNDIIKMLEIGHGAQREVADIAMTRYACYLVAQNGDSNKEPIAFAQTYFAMQTRKQELIEKRMLEVARLKAREKLSLSEKKLSGVIYERGVDEKGFAIIRSKGDEALFGGYSTKEMKGRLAIPEKRPLADFLPTLTIKAKDFAAELTSHNVKEKDLQGQSSITHEHVDNNAIMRKTLLERGVRPEALPPEEDVKKTKRRLEKETEKSLQA